MRSNVAERYIGDLRKLEARDEVIRAAEEAARQRAVRQDQRDVRPVGRVDGKTKRS